MRSCSLLTNQPLTRKSNTARKLSCRSLRPECMEQSPSNVRTRFQTLVRKENRNCFPPDWSGNKDVVCLIFVLLLCGRSASIFEAVLKRQLEFLELPLRLLRRLQVFLRRRKRLVAQPFLHGADVNPCPQPKKILHSPLESLHNPSTSHAPS